MRSMKDWTWLCFPVYLCFPFYRCVFPLSIGLTDTRPTSTQPHPKHELPPIHGERPLRVHAIIRMRFGTLHATPYYCYRRALFRRQLCEIQKRERERENWKKCSPASPLLGQLAQPCPPSCLAWVVPSVGMVSHAPCLCLLPCVLRLFRVCECVRLCGCR
jgi:hypothetical protein